MSIFVAAVASAQTSPSSSADGTETKEQLSPENAARLARLWNPWRFNGDAGISVGYDDNIYLSPAHPWAGAFVRGDLNAYLLRLPTGALSGFGFVNGDCLDFVTGSQRPTEQEWFAGAEVRWQPSSALRVSADGQGYYQDQVLDLAATTADHLIAELRDTGARAIGKARWSFHRNLWAEAEASSERSHFVNFSESFDARGGAARMGWTESRGEVSLAYSETRRDYFDRVQYTEAGRPLAGTILNFNLRAGIFKAEVDFQWGGRWSATTTLADNANRDNGSGYFDYDEKSGHEAIAWERGKWRLELDTGAERYVFLAQTVGIGVAPTPLLLEDYDERLRLERTLSRHWKLIAEDHWERTRSNNPAYGFRVNTVMAGSRMSF